MSFLPLSKKNLWLFKFLRQVWKRTKLKRTQSQRILKQARRKRMNFLKWENQSTIGLMLNRKKRPNRLRKLVVMWTLWISGLHKIQMRNHQKTCLKISNTRSEKTAWKITKANPSKFKNASSQRKVKSRRIKVPVFTHLGLKQSLRQKSRMTWPPFN